MKGLILHCGGQLKSRDEVFSVQLPETTASYVPLPNESLIERLEKHLVVEGITVTEERLALSPNGQRMFGLLAVSMPGIAETDYRMVIGVRNSYDKSCSAGICIGASVIVCDNLSFRGSFATLARKHTANLLRDLSWIITKTVGILPTMFTEQAACFQRYKETQVSDMQAHDLLIQMLDRKAINVTHVPHVLQEWREPSHSAFEENERSVWRLFNAVTETVKGDLWRLPARTRLSHEVLDQVITTAC